MTSVPEKTDSTVWLVVSRCLAVTVVAVVAVLFITAGQLVQSHRLENVHGAAAIALHVASGALALALLALARRRRCEWWAAVLAVALFGYSFVQAYLGKGDTLSAHIPGALLVAAASIWLVCWLFGRRRS
jgi:hypothetical protein